MCYPVVYINWWCVCVCVCFPASTGIISGEIRLLFAKLWLTHRHLTFIKKNHVANLPEKDSKVRLLFKYPPKALMKTYRKSRLVQTS